MRPPASSDPATSTSSLTGAGLYQATGGTLTVNGTVTVSHLTHTGGTLVGTHTFANSALTWNGSDWNSAGTTTLGTGTTLTAPTVAAALQNDTVIIDSLQAGNGNIRRGLREHSGNLFTNYNFARNSRLAGFGLGAGANDDEDELPADGYAEDEGVPPTPPDEEVRPNWRLTAGAESAR